MTARVVMIQGTSSSVGKSLLVTALCRLFARRGVRVAPFKAQNMSNNAAVCADGAEIGRSQAVQAAAAGVEPTADINPILLKPEGNTRSQVIVAGRPWRTLTAGHYYQHKTTLWSAVTTALERVRMAYELVIIEGAGSPAELNLQAGDIVNMAVARYARAPVLLLGDIDRGGIFAQLLGTVWLLSPADQALVRGLVVNKFRGDLALFADGVRILEARSARPVLGVIPFLPEPRIPEEDSAVLDQPRTSASWDAQVTAIDIAIIRLPRIANFDDFSPLQAEANVAVRYVNSGATLGRPHAVILPGTKSTVADLVWLREQGLAGAITELAATGTAVVGICGGYQMLGRRIRDPERVESSQPSIAGLRLLPVETVFAADKATHQAEARIVGGPGWLQALRGQLINGYEIHMGQTSGDRPWLELTRRSHMPVYFQDGAVNATGQIWGCYLHGLFANPALRRAWLTSLGWQARAPATSPPVELHAALDSLASHVEAHLDMPCLEAMIWGA
ncbi:Cobyric acid synthase [Candidatus Entotheonellaceae bacterium PAL068K]